MIFQTCHWAPLPKLPKRFWQFWHHPSVAHSAHNIAYFRRAVRADVPGACWASLRPSLRRLGGVLANRCSAALAGNTRADGEIYLRLSPEASARPFF